MALFRHHPVSTAAPILAGVCLAALAASTANAANAVAAIAPPPLCSPAAYAYAGEYTRAPAAGIEADLSALGLATVPYGHVAAWIGVGSATAGPGGEQDWLQAGLDTVAGSGDELYAEIAQPGQPIRHVTLAANVAPRSSYRLAVVRVAHRPNVWQVTLGGAPATEPVYLPSSRGFEPMAMSESWNGGQTACNGFSYRFDGLRVAGKTGAWKPLTNPGTLSDKGFQITSRTAAGFTAGSD